MAQTEKPTLVGIRALFLGNQGKENHMKLEQIVTDCMLLAGVAGVSYGCWEAYAPAGYIAAGLMMLVGGLLRGLAEARGGEK